MKFLEGYYLILATKRNKIGFIGNHTIYTIKDTTIYRICSEGTKSSNPLEAKYLKMFMNVDLSSNFYFSYSYDLTRTLQYNLADPKFVGENVDIESEEPLNWNGSEEDRTFAFRSISRKKFVWNEFLLQPMQKKVLHKDWMLELIHGFINQSSISIFDFKFLFVSSRDGRRTLLERDFSSEVPILPGMLQMLWKLNKSSAMVNDSHLSSSLGVQFQLTGLKTSAKWFQSRPFL